ncbi:hypothetical protein EV193_10522 [Herbihabitans rhizosphaerae]|uniref:Carboxypeptidase family protein n=1 Tax=Herbihabitans rhizosphaerae TaxID=1872711 RepID=A0A4Q7KMG9_9PSEU|nr:carboxypeptidase-like regulatory domain-containing protein [Herbihabitans rhizosphaerae]RZS37467.1 hypothetical protein EV193_10522 [Herbihabitans rhizosphaerae]
MTRARCVVVALVIAASGCASTPGTLSGFVISATGPVAGATIDFKPVSTVHAGVPDISPRTDAKGFFSVSTSAAEYEVTARLGERRSNTARVTVDADETATIRLSM